MTRRSEHGHGDFDPAVLWVAIIAAVITLAIVLYVIAASGQKIERVEERRKHSVAKRQGMTLERQLEELARLGLELGDGVTIDDLLLSFPRREYEQGPYETLLYMLGAEVEREPWGRRVSDDALSLDTEAVEGDGAYAEIVEGLARVAGMQGRVTEIRDSVEGPGKGWLEYTLDGAPRRLDIALVEDQVDFDVVTEVAKDLARDGKRFRTWHTGGQVFTWFYLDDATARRLTELTGIELTD